MQGPRLPVQGQAAPVSDRVAQVRIRKLERRLLRAGASIRIFVTKPGTIGKYTSIRIREGKPPGARTAA